MARLVSLAGSIVLCWAGLVAALPGALPSAMAEPPGVLDETQALALARQTGQPTVVSARTDETTLITADPVSGMLVAELTARPARVRDGAGGWRTPSSRLVRTADGSWRTEAGVEDVRVSNGGEPGVVASLSRGASEVAVSWPDALPTPTVTDSTATYSEVFPGVDLVVRADVDAVETFLVVKTREAAQNPDVRDWSMPLSTTGLEAQDAGNGVTSLVDASGAEQVVVPAALMWDSAGKVARPSTVDDLLEQVPQTRTAHVELTIESEEMTASADDSFLDDPTTTYPVVIDPVLQAAEQTRVLRVTDDWTKWGSAVGSEGKIGYNGWTSPYYRSRMFYQMKWPLNPDGTGLKPEQISNGIFQYVQVHSVQHSPCLSSSSTYRSERAKLATGIESTDTWADRTEAGGGWHPQPSVPPVTRMAVGHEDYCNKAYAEQWNLTSALKTERVDYAARSTVTVGIYSEDEADKMGWKYYWNDAGTSPKLLLTYQKVPSQPQSLNVVEKLASGKVYSPTPTLQAKLTLPDNDACYGTTCLKAEFTITEGATLIGTRVSDAVAAGGTASVTAPALQNDRAYTVTVRAFSTDVATSPPMYSPSTSVSFTTSLPPGAVTNAKLSNSSGAAASGTPPRVTTSQPYLSAVLPSGQVCPGGPCLTATFELWSGSQLKYSAVSSPGLAGATASVRTNSTTALAAAGDYTMKIRATNTTTGQVGPTAVVNFTRVNEPAKPILSGLSVSRTSFSVHVDNPLPGDVYTWTTVFTPESGGNAQEVVVTSRSVDANGTLQVPWAFTDTGDVAVTVSCTVNGTPSAPTSIDSVHLW